MRKCNKDGCKAAIHGMDDLHINAVRTIYPEWGYDGETMLCPAHKRQKSEDAAWNAALEAAASKAEEMGRQWGILRSVKMTEHANAAAKVAEAIRALKRTT